MAHEHTLVRIIVLSGVKRNAYRRLAKSYRKDDRTQHDATQEEVLRAYNYLSITLERERDMNAHFRNLIRNLRWQDLEEVYERLLLKRRIAMLENNLNSLQPRMWGG